MPKRKFLSQAKYLAKMAEEANDAHELCDKFRKEARLMAERAVCAAKEAGDALLAAKAKLKWLKREKKKLNGKEPPDFMDWVKANFHASQSTANDYMQIANNWDDLQSQVIGQPNPSIKKCLDFLRKHDEDGKAAGNGAAEDDDEKQDGGNPAKTPVITGRLDAPTILEADPKYRHALFVSRLTEAFGQEVGNGMVWSTGMLFYLLTHFELMTFLWDVRRAIAPVADILYAAQDVKTYDLDHLAALKHAEKCWPRLTVEQRVLILVECDSVRNDPLYRKLELNKHTPTEQPANGRWPDGSVAKAQWWKHLKA